jgi:hypothetical protein
MQSDKYTGGLNNMVYSQQITFRIKSADGRLLNAGTDKPSWFNLDTARQLVNRAAGQRIIEHNGMQEVCEVF